MAEHGFGGISYDINRYGVNSHGLCSYGLYSYGLHSYSLCVCVYRLRKNPAAWAAGSPTQ